MNEGSPPSGDESLRPPNPTGDRVVSSSMGAVTAEAALSVASDGSTDAVLVSRVQTDFDRAFVDHYERLVRSLTVVAGSREAADDAVQEAFVKAHLRWRKISRYDDPVGWIRRVALNQLRDRHRRNERKRRALGRLAVRADHVVHDREIDEFGELLQQLPRQQRATTALFYVEDLSIAEIATTLGISEGSVKSHLHDARKRLKPLLTPDDWNRS